MKNYIQAKLAKKDDKIEFVASDETLDRQGEVIPIDSWDLGNFKSNPVLLVNHDYQVQNIVGKALNLRFENRDGRMAMVFEPQFHEITQLSKEVKQMVEEGVLNTVSVGFLRKGPESDGDREKNELMEISFVPVPANPSAARIRSIMEGESVPEDQLVAVKAFVGGEEEVKEGRVISAKNRKLIGEAVNGMRAAIGALESLIVQEEVDDGKEVEENIASEQTDEPVKNLGKERAASKGRTEKKGKNPLRILQRAVGELQGAICEFKSK